MFEIFHFCFNISRDGGSGLFLPIPILAFYMSGVPKDIYCYRVCSLSVCSRYALKWLCTAKLLMGSHENFVYRFFWVVGNLCHNPFFEIPPRSPPKSPHLEILFNCLEIWYVCSVPHNLTNDIFSIPKFPPIHPPQGGTSPPKFQNLEI